MADKPVASLGDIEAGRIYDHEFTLRNKGRTALSITQIRPSCGVVAKLSSSQRTVAPGQSVTVLARLDARNVIGPFSRKVTLTTNASQGRDVELSIDGTAVAPVNVVPCPIELGLLFLKKEKSVEGVIEIPPAVSHRLDSVWVPDDRFSLSLKGDKDARVRPFELTFNGSVEPAHIFTSLIVKLHSKPEPLEVRIPVRVEVYGDLRYARDVYLLHEQGGTSIPRDVPLTTRSGKSFRVLKAFDPKKNASVEIVAPGGSPAVLRLMARAEPAQEKIEGRIVFETDLRGENKGAIHYVILASSQGY